MRKLLFVTLLFLPLALVAQIRFGYFKYSELLQRLPEYEKVQADYEELQNRCKMEIEHNEQELTRSYVAFLNGQNEFPEPILRKRQKELQELVDKSVLFRDELNNWLAQAHDSLFAPIHAKINDAVARVCLHNNLAYIVDLERAGYAFVNPANGFDVTEAVLGTISLIGESQNTSAPVDDKKTIIADKEVATDNKETTPPVDGQEIE